MKIMEKIRGKIAERLKERFGAAQGEEIVAALREQHIEQQILLLLRQDRIQLLNQHNQPVYLKQIRHALDHHDHELHPVDATVDGACSDNEVSHLLNATGPGLQSRSKLVSPTVP
jgi:phosphoglycerate-specific signal transduction histidine kinase